MYGYECKKLLFTFNNKNKIIIIIIKYLYINLNIKIYYYVKAFKDPYMLDSLKNEIKVMDKLTSPNVVKMFDVFHNP